MAKKNKNPAQFTEDEMNVIENIALKLAMGFYGYIERYKSPDDYVRDLRKVYGSDSNLAFSAIALNTKNMDVNQSFFPDEINKILARLLVSESENYLNPADLSRKVLGELKNDGIFLNVRGKQNIKSQLPKRLPRKHKSGEPKRQGYFSVYKLNDEIEKYKQILSNPQAIELINRKLLKIPGLLEETYYRSAMNSFYAAMDERLDKVNALAINAHGFPGQQFNPSDWQRYREFLLSIKKNNQLEAYAKAFAAMLLQNPNTHVFLLISQFSLVRTVKS